MPIISVLLEATTGPGVVCGLLDAARQHERVTLRIGRLQIDGLVTVRTEGKTGQHPHFIVTPDGIRLPDSLPLGVIRIY